MIKGTIALILAILLTAIVQAARADSLVCQYEGRQLIYTEVEKSHSSNEVKSVDIYASMSKVVFYNDKVYRFNSIIPCVMIKEDVGKIRFLRQYLAQFEDD